MDESEFNELKKKLASYAPLIPDVVIDYYMEKCGVESCDPSLKKAISLMSHKFLTDVATGAFQHHKINAKALQKDKRFGREKKPTLQMADLEKTLDDMGINITRPYYYM